MKKIKRDFKKIDILYHHGFFYHDFRGYGEIPRNLIEASLEKHEVNYLITLEIMDFLQASGFLGYFTGEIHRGGVKYRNILFDGKEPSWITPLKRKVENKAKIQPSTVFIDVVTHRNYTESDILGFKERLFKANYTKKSPSHYLHNF
ncbi:MAG: hypothetical protein ACTSRC_19060 [Candidatus Helarchaeota archaeon]